MDAVQRYSSSSTGAPRPISHVARNVCESMCWSWWDNQPPFGAHTDVPSMRSAFSVGEPLSAENYGLLASQCERSDLRPARRPRHDRMKAASFGYSEETIPFRSPWMQKCNPSGPISINSPENKDRCGHLAIPGGPFSLGLSCLTKKMRPPQPRRSPAVDGIAHVGTKWLGRQTELPAQSNDLAPTAFERDARGDLPKRNNRMLGFHW